MIKARQAATGSPWYWTDDTAMALTIVRMLCQQGEIEASGLAAMFADTYQADPYRGYGMTVLLPRLAEEPDNWRTHASALSDEQRSLPAWLVCRLSGSNCASRCPTGRRRSRNGLRSREAQALPDGHGEDVQRRVVASDAAQRRQGHRRHRLASLQGH
jgi:hypothetical protein